MTQLYNRTSEKAKRQQLRRNMTKAEFMIWQKLKGKQLEGYKFRSQYSVGSFVIDFYCPELKLAIEMMGTVILKMVSKNMTGKGRLLLSPLELDF